MTEELKSNSRSRAIGVVVMSLMGLLILALILPGLQATRGSRRHEGVNRLRNVSLGYLNSCVQTDAVIKDVLSEHGEAVHSWETLLLPTMDESALFRRIDLGQAWDAEANRDVMKTRLSFFQSPDLQGHYDVQDRTGFALSHLSANSRLWSDERVKTFDDLESRCSKTILLGEIQDGFLPWGQPGNLRDPAVGLNVPGGFGHPRKTGVLFAFGDGHVEFVDAGVDQKVLDTMATPVDDEF
ncbi:DUF1559 family PulG-like putative transporter [Lacunimicrobium album]